jgi:hypothetical protein
MTRDKIKCSSYTQKVDKSDDIEVKCLFQFVDNVGQSYYLVDSDIGCDEGRHFDAIQGKFAQQ